MRGGCWHVRVNAADFTIFVFSGSNFSKLKRVQFQLLRVQAWARTHVCLPALFQPLSLSLTTASGVDWAVAAANLTAVQPSAFCADAHTRTTRSSVLFLMWCAGSLISTCSMFWHKHMQINLLFIVLKLVLCSCFLCHRKYFFITEHYFLPVFQWPRRGYGSVGCPTSAGPSCSRPYTTCWKGKKQHQWRALSWLMNIEYDHMLHPFWLRMY